MSTDRLVELFLQAARGEDDSGQMHEPDQAGIDRAIAHMEMLMTSEEAAQVVAPASTFTLLGMALEEKPRLGRGAVASYKKALQLLRGNDWERCVLLQQLGAASLRVGLFEEALGWLKECSELCRTAAGHPRDVKLFQGSFSTQQTRLEFASMVEKFLCQTCMKLGDSAAAQAHASEAQRLQQQLSGDAVERTSAGATDAGASARNELDPYKQLWAERPSEEVRLKQYRFVDEGPTVLVMLDLNDHLPIGHDASAAVTSLRQFRVTCEEKAVQIQLRLRSPDANGRVMHFILRLDPLSREIIPEDTVPRLRGKEAKRRLEVKLFKREKDQKWFGDLVAELPKPEKNEKHRKGAAPKGSLLNPLTPEEIAKLPKPGTTSSDNRPSSFVPEGRQGSQERPENERPAESKEVRNSTSWVEQVSHERLDGQVVLSIQLKESLSDVTMDDLDLAVDDVSRAMSLTFEKCPGDVLHLALPEEKVGDLEARWRKKLKTLELRFPLL